MSAGRRILIVAPSVPEQQGSGSGSRVYHLTRHLAQRHDVTLVCYGGADSSAAGDLVARVENMMIIPPPRPPGGKRVQQIASVLTNRSYELRRLTSAAMQSTVSRLVESERFDVVQLETTQMAWLQVPRGQCLVLDAQNIEHEMVAGLARTERSALRRAYNRGEARRLERDERNLWARLGGCAVPSHHDASIVMGAAPRLPVQVVANSVDLDYFQPRAAPTPAAAPLLVLTGTMNYRPNVDAALHFVRDVLPLVRRSHPDARVRICGMNPPREVRALAGQAVEVTGRVEDMRPHLAAATVVVVPLRSGGGTRLKILEALAMGRPVVSTTLGREGLELRNRVDLLVADGPAAFAASVVRLLGDPSSAEQLGRNGRDRVSAAYGWQAAGDALENLHHRVATQARAA